MKGLVAEPKLDSRDIIEVALNLSGICASLDNICISELCQVALAFSNVSDTEAQENLIHQRNVLQFYHKLISESNILLNTLIEPNIEEKLETIQTQKD